jgi:hypothetical protein
MGYHHCQIPSLETLIKQFTLIGIDKFVAKYSKCEYLVGDSDAIGFIEDKISEWKGKK